MAISFPSSCPPSCGSPWTLWPGSHTGWRGQTLTPHCPPDAGGPTAQDAVPSCGSPPCPGRGDLHKPSSNLRAPVSRISISGTDHGEGVGGAGAAGRGRACPKPGLTVTRHLPHGRLPRSSPHRPGCLELGAATPLCCLLPSPSSTWTLSGSGHPEALACREVLAERRLGEGCSGGRLCSGPRSWNVRMISPGQSGVTPRVPLLPPGLGYEGLRASLESRS